MRIIKLIKKGTKKGKPKKKLAIYNICLVKKSSHKNLVYEKLGTFSLLGNKLTINLFRLCYWLSKNVSMTGNVVLILKKHNIFLDRI